MLNIIYCRDEKQKNSAVYGEISRLLSKNEGKTQNIILLVPEQQVLESEKTTAGMGLLSFDLQVLSFGRLANEIFRRFGGLSHKYIDKGASHVVMYRVLCELEGALSEYNNITLRDRSSIKLLQDAITEFKNAGITPGALEDVAEKLPGGDKLAAKLLDLATIMTAQKVILGQKYVDPADDLTLAAKILDKNNFFENTHVFINSFDGFTGAELDIIKNMIKNADGVTVAINMLLSDSAQCFEKLKTTDKALRGAAKDHNVPVRHTSIEGDDSQKSEVLSFVCENLWDFDAVYEGKNDAVQVFSCKDDFEQAKCVAADILKKVKNGADFRDFAVIMREPEKYLGILDNVFSACNIPLHFSVRTDIKRHPEIRMISCAIQVGAYGWKTDDVISYMRTGMTGLDMDACDALEDYFSLWKVSGKNNFAKRPLKKHPEGFGKEFDEKSNLLLEQLNTYKKALIDPLDRFLSVFDGGEARVLDVCVALYSFVDEIKLKARLEQTVNELAGNGDLSQAEEKRQVWNTIISALDSLYSVASDMKCDAKGFLSILDTVLECTDIGKIPQGVNEVIAAGPLLLRKSDVKHAYVIGVNEGVFPAIVSEDLLIADEERRILRELGLDIYKSRDTRVADELYTFYRTVTMPRESLTFTCLASKSVSQALENLMRSLKIEKPTPFVMSHENVFCATDAVEYAISKGCSSYASKFIPRLSESQGAGVRVGKENLGIECAHGIFFDKMSLSQSKLDSYSMCPQAYYCRYILKLREKATSEAGSNTVGSFVHEILEKFFLELDGRDLQTLSAAESKQILDKVLSKYGSDMISDESTAREKGLYNRIERLIRLLADNLRREFSVSKFAPYTYEMPIGMSEAKNGVKALDIYVDDDFSVSLCGYIDRVDIYKRGDDAYVRVVDYKTGKKDFKKEDMELGINLQMPLYLHAFCKDEALSEKLAPNGRLLPAGVLYFAARHPDFKSDDVDVKKSDDVYEKAVRSIKRNGIVLDDEEIILAMDPEKTGELAPVSYTKKGISGKALISDKELEELTETVLSTVADKAKMMRSGCVSAEPLKQGSHDACKYCAMRPVCRRSDASDEDDD